MLHSKSKIIENFKKWCIFLSLGLITACSSDLDLAPPSIELFSPQQNETYTTASPLAISLSCIDDLSAYSYQITINTTDTTLTQPWDTLILKSINGQNTKLNLQIDLPINLHNTIYHLNTFCVDRLGQISDTVNINFKLINTNDHSPPNVAITSPNANDTIYVFSGGTLVLIGSTTDNVGLLDMKVYFQSANIPFQYPNHIPIRYKPLNNQTAYQFVEIINIPQQEGFYLLHLVLRDKVNNLKIVSRVLKAL